MSAYEVDKLLYRINNDADLAERCRVETPQDVLASLTLTTDERAALGPWNVRALYDLGVNPFLLLSSSVSRKVGLLDYVMAITVPAADS